MNYEQIKQAAYVDELEKISKNEVAIGVGIGATSGLTAGSVIGNKIGKYLTEDSTIRYKNPVLSSMTSVLNRRGLKRLKNISTGVGAISGLITGTLAGMSSGLLLKKNKK